MLVTLCALLLLSGCGGGDTAAPLTPGADGFRMVQKSSVSRETFRDRMEFADFLDHIVEDTIPLPVSPPF